MKRGKGPYLYDYDENRFVDFELGGGNLLLGHAPPRLTSVIKAWLGRGFSPGYSSASHRLLSKTIHEVIYNKSENDLQFIYSDSVYQAVAMILELFSAKGKCRRGVYVHNRKKNTQGINATPIFYHSLQTSRFDEIKDLNTDITDCAIIQIDENVDMETVRDTLKWLNERSIPIIGDATKPSSFLHLTRVGKWYRGFDATICGSWLAAGLPFSAVIIHHPAILGTNGGEHSQRNLDLLLETGTPPQFKLKMVQRSVQTLQKLGGFSALLDKHKRFCLDLDKRYFQLCEGFVCFREDDRLISEYTELRLHLFRKGFLFPPVPARPLALSLVHSDELLEKSAHGINEHMVSFFQSS
jgi:hypothetical protein